ncbi:MAG: Hpt domain-containing protein [Pirellulales bacterium]|nr:Hpt domain-containing protein [Pirellulales bacterium]
MAKIDAANLSGVIDLNELMTRCLNNLEFAERMLTLFENRCGDDLTELERAFEQGDVEKARRVSHRFAGASANAAAGRLHGRATELRNDLREGSLDAARPRLHELRQEWQRFTEAMSSPPLVRQA